MPLVAGSIPGSSLNPTLLRSPPPSSLSRRPPPARNSCSSTAARGTFLGWRGSERQGSWFAQSSNFRAWSFQEGDGEILGSSSPEAPLNKLMAENGSTEIKEKRHTSGKGSFLTKLALAVGLAAILTVVSVSIKQRTTGSALGFQILAENSASLISTSPPVGFNFKAFGYKILLPEYAPGWVYFWLLMAAGCGLFISEEALNIWVGISLSRMLSLDGTWQSFVTSFSRNSQYILSTFLWVYWGVCISDMVPFYLGKFFRQSGGSDDVCAKLGIGKEKALSITRAVQKYGNLIGFVERFSLGVRNPTAFLAGALGISPEYFFAGVCCGGLITLPVQLGIGFLLRERPLFALATVATVVGIWTIFPYAIAALTALFLFMRRHYST